MRILGVMTSALASGVRGGQGSRRVPGLENAARPAALLELYSFEGCPFCRRVRERLSELDLDYIHRSCPKGESPNRAKLKELGGKIQVPYLVDPNTGTRMYESDDIITYLDRTYGPGAGASR
jgi:glutaredoxin